VIGPDRRRLAARPAHSRPHWVARAADNRWSASMCQYTAHVGAITGIPVPPLPADIGHSSQGK
jgi:hypothetical protein